MIILILAVAVIGGILFIVLISGIFVYYALAIRNQKPLDEDMELCKRIVEEGRGYLFICNRAVKTAIAPAIPAGS